MPIKREPAIPLPVRSVAPLRPFVWLRLGWQDMLAAPLASLVHGMLVLAGGWIILAIARAAWPL
ncbi:MAG TPA: hypothetical protein VNK91_05085, partial [Burkholderiaceae bacterium]|nr:hypothetical protein [Burkholderiaceae bacterium]